MAAAGHEQHIGVRHGNPSLQHVARCHAHGVFTDEHAGQAVAAAVAAAGARGVRAAEPAVLHNSCNLLVHLRPAPVVARVATATALVRPDVAAWLSRDLAIADHLVKAGVPAVAPSAELPMQPVHQDGFCLTFWTYTRHSADHRPRKGEVAALIADLHAALRDFPGPLPDSPVSELPYALDLLAGGRWLDATAVAELRAEHRWIEAALHEVPDRQAVHGDAHPGNLLATEDGLRWNDFEDTWFGPRAWDLACLAGTTRMDGEAELAHYPDATARDALALCRAGRRLQVLVWTAVLNAHFGDERGDLGVRLAHWRAGRMAG